MNYPADDARVTSRFMQECSSAEDARKRIEKILSESDFENDSLVVLRIFSKGEGKLSAQACVKIHFSKGHHVAFKKLAEDILKGGEGPL